MPSITQERAERVAKSHPCSRCGEYSYKRVRARAASAAQRESLQMAWEVQMICGVCDAHREMGIDDDGDVVYDA